MNTAVRVASGSLELASTTTMSAKHRVSFVAGTEGLASVEVLAGWRAALCRSTNLRVAFQTPEWAEYRSGFAGRLSLCITRNQQGDIVGVSPLLESNYALGFSVGKKTLYTMSVGCFLLMGNVPVMPADPQAYQAFFEALALETGVNAVSMLSLPLSTEFSSFLERLEKRPDSPWFFYRPFPAAAFYYIRLPATFDDYLKTLDSKMRRNLKREAKLLETTGAGELELVRITRPEQVAAFLNDARAIAANSWKKGLGILSLDQSANGLNQVLVGMAKQGMLRAYVLRCASKPCAYALGFQLNGTFYFHDTAYDEKWSKFSLGKAMIYRFMQDLFAHEPPQTFFFGSGDAAYKRWFGSATGNEVNLLVLRKNFSNRLKVGVHRRFRSIVDRLKRLRTINPSGER